VPINPNELGRDLIIGEDGDLAIYGNGFDVINGADHAVLRFSRELMSPHGLLSRYMLDYNGLQALDDNYGNEAFSELAEPMDQNWIERVKIAIYNVADEQPNLLVEKIDYSFLDVSNRRLAFDIQIQVDGGSLKRLYLETGVLGFNVRVVDGNRT
jgi:hypothetical protein